MLYVLDEPSIGLHPDNLKGLVNVFRKLIAQGNSLVVVDHDVDMIAAADWVIEIGPGSGAAGGQIIATGTPRALTNNPNSLIGPFLAGRATIMHPKVPTAKNGSSLDTEMKIQDYFNLKQLKITIPGNQITAVTGFSGAGKTSLILDSLVPAIQAHASRERLPQQVTQLKTKFTNVVSVDAKPVGKNTRSTLATYTTIMDQLRTLFAAQPAAKQQQLGRAAFSYNNKQGACPNCGGVGTITLDVQYLPDVVETCPVCHGTQYKDVVQQIRWHGYSIVDILNMSVKTALPVFAELPKIEQQLQLLTDIGLDYLHLGESTPSLSGGEAQRLKLVSHLKKTPDQNAVCL